MTSHSDDPELKLEVDLMTLDYLLYKAIIAVIQDRRAERNGEQAQQLNRGAKNSDNILGIFDGFMQLFRYNHLKNTSSDSNDDSGSDNNNNTCFPQDLKIKLQILTVANLLCRRYAKGSSTLLPSEGTLQFQRKRNKERAELWLRQNEASRINCGPPNTAVITSTSFLERNHRDMFLHMGIPYEDDNLNILVNLLDILPECMSLCAMVPHRDIPDTSWMELPVRFMLYATIEEVLLHGKKIAETANEAFAWGYPYKVDGDEGSDENDAQAHIVQWELVRDSVKASLVRADGEGDWEARIEEILEKSPLVQFEEYVIDWLTELLGFQNTPILVQLEEGTLEGLTLDETAAFLDRVGIQ
ncbi:hypothetical protein AJ78_05710 [Emergomyces pasteurianus Ep9510]|uniref:Uncharacterized protein n=1 Tax=Emergomyces pasteurianus Ep9510 TaxID=1447872 RepID=A0A1J9PBG4_9EURO|nr:hypothetical protein AJ78_05710 [Emergomyces pasteurianus Ep9510]